MKTVIEVHFRNIQKSIKINKTMFGWINFNNNGQGKQQIKNIEKN